MCFDFFVLYSYLLVINFFVIDDMRRVKNIILNLVICYFFYMKIEFYRNFFLFCLILIVFFIWFNFCFEVLIIIFVVWLLDFECVNILFNLFLNNFFDNIYM